MNKRVLAGGLLILALTLAGAWYAQTNASSKSTTHTYYIAADPVTWDYAPSGMDKITGKPFDSVANFWVESGPTSIGRVYKKALYYEYTDDTFSERKPRPPEWEHLGFLGPLIRATVGDTIRVVFKNNVHFPASLHPHGVFYNKDSEGAPYYDGTEGADKADDGVTTGATHTYVWPVPERAGPAEGDPSSILWMYHSHVAEVNDVNAGLTGPMIITGRGTTNSDGTPKDVDRELIVAFAEFDENESHYLRENIDTYTGMPDSVRIVTGIFGTAVAVPGPTKNFMETMNGLSFGHLPGLTMRQGERVRWYIMASTNFEIHAPHWHGNVVTAQHMRTDVAALLPMGMLVADMVPDNPGKWLFHCHVGGHLLAGMQSVYTVEPADGMASQ